MAIHLRHTLINAGSFLIGATVIGNFLNLAYNAYLGKQLSLAQFGTITLINTLLYIVNIFINALATTTNQRVAFLSARSGRSAATLFYKETVQKLIPISIALAAVWLVLTPVLQSYFNLATPIPIVSILPVVIIGSFAAVSSGYVKGLFLFLFTGLFILVEAFSKLVIAHFLIASRLSDATYLSIPIAILISFILSIAVAKQVSRKYPSSSKHDYRFNRSFYVASLLAGISTNAFLTFDVLLTKHYFTALESGTYAFLALFGKMIYFFGSLFNTFMISFVSRAEGAKRDPNHQFYILLTISTVLTFLGFIGLMLLGPVVLPHIFGNKIVFIKPYLALYALAISIYTISNTINIYHLARKQYLFPIVSLMIVIGMIIGINLHHSSLHEVIESILLASSLNLGVLLFLHAIQRNGGFFLMNLVDLFELLRPLPRLNYTPLGKRILIFNWRDTRHAYAGGAETYIQELGKRWVKAGNAVTIFCGNDGNAARYEMIDGIQVIRRGGFYMVYIWAFIYYIFRLKGRYEVILDCENGIPFFTPLYAKEKIYLLIHHVHQEVFRKSLIWPFSSIASFLEIKVMPYVYKNTQFITVSPSTKDEILSKCLTTTDPFIVYNGVDRTKYTKGKKSKRPLVLYLGRLQYYKSIHVFIKMAKKISASFPSATFMIAGEGEEMKKLKLYAHRLGSPVIFVGKVSEEEKVRLLQSAWVVVNPSSMEGWGLTVIEANACGTPVVASDVPGLRDSVKDRYSGYRVPYGNVAEFQSKVTSILKSNALRKKLYKNAVTWSKRFDWSISTKASLKIFQA